MIRITEHLFLFLTLFFSVAAHSQSENNILFSLQRHTYIEGSKSVSIGLRNGETEPYLVQSGMVKLDISNGVSQLEEDNTDIPFIVIPPLHKFTPNSYYDWRIVFSGDERSLPKDRESVYLAKFLFIPSSQKNKTDNTDISVIRSFIFKIYYRPKNIETIKINDIQDKISFHRRGNTLLVKNNSPIFVTFDTLRINSKEIDNKELFKPVPPLSEQMFNVPQGIPENNQIEWKLLDEYSFPLDKNISKATSL
ncbi:molecular chaperone [Morganella psychrotolerans]|uniref:fimbrial biogenesis chaperone n=1 Tax=Morganella psychrotolerans TaxID=368603 RepID=UPI0039B00400